MQANFTPVTLSVLTATVLALVVPAASASCLHYGGNPVTLSGKVSLQTFYGPPNYGETPDIDAKETQAILLLKRSMCVTANPHDEDESAETSQLEVTLLPMHQEKLAPLVNQTIRVEGYLLHAHSAHHHTPILMRIKRIRR